MEQSEVITLTGSDGAAINGLPNPFTSAYVETPYDNQGNVLPRSADGIDPEALVRLNNGNFWVADEYGPSLLLVSSTGEILERQVPAGLVGQLAAANYPVSGNIIPAIFERRAIDRGIEALALSPDNKYLYFFMQGPLDNPTNGCLLYTSPSPRDS